MKEKFGLNVDGQSSVIGNYPNCFEGKAVEKRDFPNRVSHTSLGIELF